MKKGYLLLAVLVTAVAGAFAWNEFHRTAATADEMPVAEIVTATELLAAFAADEAAATARYVGTADQVVQVSGNIRSMGSTNGLTNVVLGTSDPMAGVVCEFRATALPAKWKVGDAVEVKGICTGLLMDVVLVRCTAVE